MIPARKGPRLSQLWSVTLTVVASLSMGGFVLVESTSAKEQGPAKRAAQLMPPPAAATVASETGDLITLVGVRGRDSTDPTAGAVLATSADPTTSPEPAPVKAPAKKPSKKKRPAVVVSGAVALQVIYDDNIIHYSDDDLEQFATEPNLGKFAVHSADDVIVRPRLDLTLASRELTGKTLSLRLRYSSWRYRDNGIKNNESYALLLKHPGFGRDNFQLTLYHAPMSYLRNFLDRPPLSPRSDPSQYTAFSFASNTGSLAYWKRWSNTVDAKLELARSARYYNRPFMENDNWEWRLGGYVSWKFHRRLTARVEYFYSDVRARAADTVGEEAQSSDDGDASYERDSYELTLSFAPKGGLFKMSSVSVGGQYQAYYFTSTKPYFEDPYHVGRKDQVYRMEITALSVKILGPARLETGYRFTERTSSAAFDSGNASIGEDKDYTDNRFWLGTEYSF